MFTLKFDLLNEEDYRVARFDHLRILCDRCGVFCSTEANVMTFANLSPMDCAIVKECYARLFNRPLNDNLFIVNGATPVSSDWENTVEAFLCRN